MSRRHMPLRLGAFLLVVVAFLVGATSAFAATTSATVLDQGFDVLTVADTSATTQPVDPPVVDPPAAPAPVDNAPVETAPTPAVTPLDATPTPTPDPAPATPVVAPDPAPPTTATTATTTTADPTPAATTPAQPAPDQLSPGLLAQVNAATPDAAAATKSTADAPPAATVARTVPDIDVGTAATPAAPPPIGDEPPGALIALRKAIPRPTALVPVLLPGTPTTVNAAGPAPREEVTATRARPVWNEFVWRSTGNLGGSADLGLGTRALLAIIGMLPFAPVDGPDRTAPPLSQLALLIPVMGLVAFLFATRPIVDPRRRGPQSYRAVALKPG